MLKNTLYLILLPLITSFFSPKEIRNCEPEAIEIVENYNARDIGSPGERHVLLELKSKNVVTRSFEVTNLWMQKKNEVKTLFFLKQPKNLRGTCYLLTEDYKKEIDMGVHLYLPSGKHRVLSIAPDNFDQGLLGSDFGYNDLKMQLPTQGYDFQTTGQTSINGFRTWIIRVKPNSEKVEQAISWTYVDLYLTIEFPFLMQMDYYKKATSSSTAAATQLYKRMRVECLDKIDGVWTASKIIMDVGNGQSSELSLENIEFNLKNIEPEMFSPESLPQMQEHRAW